MFDPISFADDVSDDFGDFSVEHERASLNEVDVRLKLRNPDWGMPSDFYRLLESHDAHIVDFRAVTRDHIIVTVTGE